MSSSPPLLAALSTDLKLWSWDPAEPVVSPQLHTSYGSGGGFQCLAWNHSNRVIAVAGEQPKIDLVDIVNGQAICSLSMGSSESIGMVRAVAFTNNSRYLAAAAGPTVQLWDLRKRQIRSVFSGHKSNVESLAFNAVGDVYALDASGVPTLWSSKSQAPLHTLIDPAATHANVTLSGHTLSMSVLTHHIAAGYNDGTLRIWDCATGSMTRKQCSHTTRVSSIAWSPVNARLLSTASLDGKICLVNINDTQNTICEAIDAKIGITSLSAHHNGIHIAAGTLDGRVLIYDWRQPSTAVMSFSTSVGQMPVNALAFQVKSVSSSTSASNVSVLNSSAVSIGAPVSSSNAAAAQSSSSQRLSSVMPATSVTSLNSKPATPPSDAYPASIAERDRERDPSISRHSRSTTPNRTVAATLSQSNLMQHNSMIAAERRSAASGGWGLNTSSMSSHRGGESADDVAQRVHSMIDAYEQSVVRQSNASIPMPNPPVTQRSQDKDIDEEEGVERLTAFSSSRSKPVSATAVSRKYTTSAPPEPMRAEERRETYNSVSFREELRQIEQERDQEDQLEHETYKNRTGRTAAALEEAQQILQQRQNSQQVQLESQSMKEDRSISASGANAHIVSSRERPGSAPETHEDWSSLRRTVQPVTAADLEESLQLLKYDLHAEMQGIIREQARQFAIANEDTRMLIQELSLQLTELLMANKQLRDENEQLRKIY